MRFNDGMVLLTTKQVSELLQVRPARTYELVRQNLIPHVKMGKQIRFSEAQIHEWIKAGGCGLDDKVGGGGK